MTFDDFFLDEALIAAVSKQGYQSATAVQEAAIPVVLSGKDVMACAATGTGKTAAYVLPILQKLMDQPTSGAARILVLAPTRELVHQIQHVFHQLGAALKPSIACVTGGVSPAGQAAVLQQANDIIIATPGRLVQLANEEQADLSQLEMVVIDEADRMLDMGQGPDVLALLAMIEQRFQVCLFSATLAGSGVDIFARELVQDAEYIDIHAANKQADQIEHCVYIADNKQHKQALLLAVINQVDCQSALVFCNKKTRADEVCEFLQSKQVSAQVMHGDFSQAERRDRVRKFRIGKIKVLVATDVAARGLDMSNISHVINFDMPYRGDIYIHRVGRTGRALKQGYAISLVEHFDLKNLQRVEHHLDAPIPRRKLPGLTPKSRTAKQDKKKLRKDQPRYVSKRDRVATEETDKQ